MPYVFPRRRLRDNDVLDPTEFNEDITPAADLYSGRLDEQNFSPSPALSVELNTDVATTPDSTYSSPLLSNSAYNVYFIGRSASPGWGEPNNYANPTGGSARRVVKNISSWQTIDIGDAKDGTVKIYTGNSKLWVIACFQYIWTGFTNKGGHHYSYPPAWDASSGNESKWGRYPCMVQFALRVDGQIIESTVTGFDDLSRKIVQPYRLTQTRATGDEVVAGGSNTVLPGPGQDGEANCGALSPECHSIRLGTWVPVAAGTHTIELVARRYMPTPYRQKNEDDDNEESDQISYGMNNEVAVYNRQLLVVDYPLLAPALSGASSVSVGAFRSEDTFSSETLGTKRIDKLRDSFNDIQRGAVDRGAFNRRHLVSKVVYAEQASAQPRSSAAHQANNPGTGPETFLACYPGYGDDTVSTSTIAGDNWYGPLSQTPIAGEGGGTLRVSPALAVQNKSIILLLANVEVQRINKTKILATSPVASGNTFCALCLFTKATNDSGTVEVQYGLNESVINRDTHMGSGVTPWGPDGEANALDPVAHDVPLMQLIIVRGEDDDGTSADSNGNVGVVPRFREGTTFDEFYVAGSVMVPEESTSSGTIPSSGSGSLTFASAEWWHGNISALILEE
jgi:hypothetical protein